MSCFHHWENYPGMKLPEQGNSDHWKKIIVLTVFSFTLSPTAPVWSRGERASPATQQQNIMDKDGGWRKANTVVRLVALKAPACLCTNCLPAIFNSFWLRTVSLMFNIFLSTAHSFQSDVFTFTSPPPPRSHWKCLYLHDVKSLTIYWNTEHQL